MKIENVKHSNFPFHAYFFNAEAEKQEKKQRNFFETETIMFH